MDKWQKDTFERMKKFVETQVPNQENVVTPVRLGISIHEAYVIMKAFEHQQRYLKPILEPGD